MTYQFFVYPGGLTSCTQAASVVKLVVLLSLQMPSDEIYIRRLVHIKAKVRRVPC